MSTAYQIVVCAGVVPDPLQTLETARQFPISDFRFEDGRRMKCCCPPSSIRGRVMRCGRRLAIG
jgi:hypothetical protein